MPVTNQAPNTVREATSDSLTMIAVTLTSPVFSVVRTECCNSDTEIET